MSKTTFEPKAKSMTLGDNVAPKETSVPVGNGSDESLSSYKSMGTSQWKALADPLTDASTANPMDYLGGIAVGFGDALGPVVDGGVLTAPEVQMGPQNQLDFALPGQIGKNAYMGYFAPIEYPPSAEEVIGLLPQFDKTQANLGIDKANVYYTDIYINLLEERKANAMKTANGQQLPYEQLQVVKQFINEIDKTLEFTNRQIDILKKYRTDNLG